LALVDDVCCGVVRGDWPSTAKGEWNARFVVLVEADASCFDVTRDAVLRKMLAMMMMNW